ncbi:MAG: hypothetical protein EOM22_08995 [Gammaproteobacteria bacterium]|jgi:hypothetical protein|nr:hypothetical protein [Gammaproteobacteria bacterium]
MSDPAQRQETRQIAPDSTRTLIYCPVIHSQVDLGALRGPVQSATHTAFGNEAWRRRVLTVEQMWTEIEQMIDGLDLDPTRTRLYQDGLPICGHELEIVKEMSYKGSRNHRILLRLHSQGATLMGTESGPLLLQEYNLAKRLLDPDQQGLDSDGRDALQMQARTLLKSRDLFIAGRINETLKVGEVGILFLGMLHDITPFLTSDIRVAYPLGTPVGSDGVAESESET